MAFQPNTGSTPNISQTNHLLSVGDWIYLNGVVYTKVDADAAASTDSVGVVSAVIDANTFRIVTDGYVSGLTGLIAGTRYYISTTAGAITATAPSTGNVKSVFIANSTTSGYVQQFAGSTQKLTYGRISATADLANTAFATTGTGSTIPFTATTYSNGVTFSGTSGIIPSVAGRYRATWFAQAGSGQFNGNGTFHIVQNSISLGSVYVDMMEAAGVNQTTPSIDVDLAADLAVTLQYQPDTADSIIWQRGSYFDLSQLPVAIAPVVDTVVEYGENNGITTGQTTASTTFVDVVGGSFTLPSAGIWEVDYKVFASGNSVGNRCRFQLVKSSDSSVVSNSAAVFVYPVANHVEGISQKVFITTTGADVYKLQFLTDGGTLIVNNANASSGGNTKITWTKIAGQLPSTGQTVDFVNARQTTTQGAPTVGTIINFEQVVSGNIPFSSNTVTLEVGKTYKLEGGGAIMAGGSSTYGTRFYNVTTGQFIGDSGFAFSPNNANTPTLVARNAMVEITPSVTTQIQLRVDFLSGSGGVIGGSNLVNGGVGAGSSFDPNGASWMRVTQLGSSAVYAGVYPGVWTNYTPNITAPTTNPTLPTVNTLSASYSIQGKTMFLNFTLSHANQTGATSGSGAYRISIPAGYVIDTTKAIVPTNTGTAADAGYDGTMLGSATRMNSGSNYIGKVVALDGNNVGLYGSTLSGTERGLWGSTFGGFTANTSPSSYSFSAQIPIV